MAEWLDLSYVEANTVTLEALNRKLREVYDRTGLEGLKEHVTRELNSWKDKRITIAVTGNSGAGKSSLINALRGIDQSHENAAEEGVTETTTERTAYFFPSNKQIVLFDIPGAGSRSHPIESYTREMNFKQYDFVVIVSKGRFMQIDAVIVKELQQLKKPFFLVRSNIEYDVNNQRKTQERADVMKKIRNDCVSNLLELGVHGTDVFLVDSHNHEDFELGQLQMSIVKNAPKEALEASLVFCYKNMTETVIEGKIQYLKDRAMLVAIIAVASAAPGAGYLMNVNVIIDEITFYKEELGLDDESLVNTSKMLGLEMTEIKKMISLTDPESFTKYILKIFSEMDDKFNLKQIFLGFLLVYIGSTISAFKKSYVKVYNTLCKILETLHLEALEICGRILEKKRQ